MLSGGNFLLPGDVEVCLQAGGNVIVDQVAI